MSGTPYQNFSTFMASTGPAFLTSAEDVINEAVKNTYTYPRLARGHSLQDMVQGGTQIQDTIFFSEKTTYERYDPNAEFEYSNPQTGTTWTVPWRFATANVSWTKHEIGLNTGQLSKKARFQQYKTLKRQKHQNLWTDICNSMDDELWAAPDYSAMEATAGKAPFSIPTYVNEYTNGVPNGWTGTNVMGIDTATQSSWVPGQLTYDGTADPFGTTAEIFGVFSKMMRSLKFDRLPKKPEYSDKTTSPHFIACSLSGIVNYEHALRVNQDEFRGGGGGQDPDYGSPMFRGVPLDYISALDTAAVYDGAGSDGIFYNESGGGVNTGPRFYFLNGEYLRNVVHADNYCVMSDPFSPSKQPWTKVQVFDQWNNLVCRSRQRHGLVSPAGVTSPLI